ncbi:hypothetical protein WN943_025552 [Citrus x changshan-huyou]
MASLSQTNFTYTIIAFILLLIISTQCGAQLSPTFYDATCPNALNTIRTGIRNAVSREIRMAASSFASISMIDSFKVVTRPFCWMIPPPLTARKMHFQILNQLEDSKL